jgi:glutamate--cysteine ligase|tara:strand:+ start:4040 stop:5626 length:1587 start_codon:yes stop_codon:yes gene_type:complete
LPLLKNRLAQLSADTESRLLSGITRGIEKESLRVTPEGKLAHTPHPLALGSALTHPQITTDYSESLLEFITPPSNNADDVLQNLENIHRFTYHHIGDELLWANSMPCQLSGDSDIPVGQYGHSNVGQMKSIYRVGLGHRYGRLMQTIAGIHYNFSVPDELWQLLRDKESPDQSLQDFKTENYFSLIRNFRRHFWLLLYLFGASPSVCRSFVRDREHQLQPFGKDDHSLHMPNATSLRMGDLGYQSKAQDQLIVCYNDIRSYVETLRQALGKPYPDYEAIGLKDNNGNHLQLSPHLLQIENEFYSTVRPKRVTHSGETPLSALWERGVEYVEVRCVDLNPFQPLGIDREQMDFMDTFLLTCLLSQSPPTDNQEYHNILENQHRMVYHGRDPELMLCDNQGERSVLEWGRTLFKEMTPVATLLDSHHQSNRYTTTLEKLAKRLDNPELTPSARILKEMTETGQTYFKVAMNHAKQHREHFLSTELPKDIAEQYREMAAQSLQDQQEIEAVDQQPFDKFLADYYQQYNFPL